MVYCPAASVLGTGTFTIPFEMANEPLATEAFEEFKIEYVIEPLGTAIAEPLYWPVMLTGTDAVEVAPTCTGCEAGPVSVTLALLTTIVRCASVAAL